MGGQFFPTRLDPRGPLDYRIRAMGMLKDDERAAAEAIAELCYTNPFTPRRFELERRALGPEVIEAPATWSRTSLRYQNPNVPGLRARTRELLGAARRALEAGHVPDDAERRIHGGLVRYFLFDVVDKDLTRLVDDVLSRHATGTEPVAFYARFKEHAEHAYGVGGLFPEPLSRIPHLFATSVQVRLAFTLIFRNLIGTSAAAARLRAAIWESIFTHDMRHYEEVLHERMHEIPTLVLGPTGTGKELVARAIGMGGHVPFDGAQGRFQVPLAGGFHALNLTALSPTLIESELFGHARGAFTGADKARKGFFELCTRHGAVFLDEIGELDETIQIKLLRVLQSRHFERVGDAKAREFHGRVIAATHQDVRAQLQSGDFRSDLYYRLRADTIRTPTLARQLAEAPGDLRTFVEIALERVLGTSERVETPRAQTLTDDLADFIERHGKGYPWPGNFRELEQCVRSFLVHRDYDPLTEGRAADDGGERATAAGGADMGLDDTLARLDLTAAELLNRYCAAQYAELGNISEVARKLGLDRRTARERAAAGKQQP